MNVGKAIYYLLANNAGVSAITTRIYPEYAPQDADAPFIVYRLTSVDPDDTHDGPAVIDEVRIEVICVSDSYDQAADMGGVARVALDRVYGTYNTVNVESIQFDDVSVSVRDQPRQYAQELTFIVRVKRDDIQIATGSPIEDVTLGRLADVDTTGATDDQVLTYDAASGTWGPEDASTVAGLDDLTDVTITTPANNQALVYNEAAGKWRNDALSLTQLEGISSELGDAIDRQALVFDEASNQWIADGVGQVVIPVRNSYRSTALTVGQVVKAVGAQGDRIKVELFDPAVDDSKLLVGVISEEIAGGADGHAQVYGELRNIDTDAFSVGDVLYPQSDGSLDTTENEYPIGIVTRSQQNTGRLFIRLWAPGKGYHQRYRTEALSEMFVGVGATVELYYTATADGDGYVTQDLTAAVGDGNVEERVLRYKAGAFGDSGTTSGYTDAGLATDATYAEMLTAFNNLLKTEGAPITIYATRTEVAARTGLLDDYPGAAAAYSLRELSPQSYTGSAIRVRRASDDAEQDIGFDGDGNLDTTALATFCSGTDGFVKVWYDQANGNDAEQTTTGNQPKIYDSSTGVITENNEAALLFDGDFFLTNNEFNQTSSTNHFYIVNKTESGTSGNNYFSESAAIDGNGSPSITQQNVGDSYYLRSATSNLFLGNFTSVKGTQGIFVAEISNSNSKVYFQSAEISSVSSSGVDAITDKLYIGLRWTGADSFKGTYQEFVFWNSDQSSNRTGIETNINDYYSIYTPFTTGLLDDYDGAAAAYSLRRLSSTYTGDAIRVRRASDNSEQDIGFDIEGNLNTGALASFCSGTDGFVKVWYDQSGNGNHATQTTTSQQPKVYDSVSGVVTEADKPILSFATNNRLNLSSNLSILNENFFYVTAETVDFTVYGLVDDTDYLRNQITRYLLKDGGTFYQSSISPSAGYSVHSVINNDGAYQNGTKLADFTNTLTISADSILKAYSAGSYQELVIYDSDQSANRTAIETNINDYYTIF